MNKSMLIVSIALSAVCLCAYGKLPSGFISDLDVAMKKASTSGKNVLVVFSGSDWSAKSRHLATSCWSKESWISIASNDFELVYIDILLSDDKHLIMSKEEKDKNMNLVHKYDIVDYPTLLVLDSSGRKLAGILPPFETEPEKLLEAARREVSIAPLVRKFIDPISNEFDKKMEVWLKTLATKASQEAGAGLNEKGQRDLFDKNRKYTSDHLTKLKELRARLVTMEVPSEIKQRKDKLLSRIDGWIKRIDSMLKTTFEEAKRQYETRDSSEI